jgi:hypothetical protein
MSRFYPVDELGIRRGYQPEAFSVVALLTQRSPPSLVGKIPLDRFLKSGLERLGRTPADFALDLGGIDGVAKVVTWAIDDVPDCRAVRLRTRRTYIQTIADALDDLTIGPLAPPSDIVAFARAPFLDKRQQSARMVRGGSTISDGRLGGSSA